MALTLLAMRTETFARGFQFDSDTAGTTRVNRWLNDALHELDELERWDYRRAVQTGTSPLTITDLGEIESVQNTTTLQWLPPTTRGALVDQGCDLTLTGSPSCFYLVAGVVTVWPVSTNTIAVNYWKVGPDLSADGDTPLMPDRYRMAIVERACAKAYLDQDDLEMSQACLAESDRIADRMREAYVLQPGGMYQFVGGYSGDW